MNGWTQSRRVAREVRFHTGEVLPELKVHYRTVRDSSGEPVLTLHGTGGSGAVFLIDAFAGELFGAGQPLDASRYFIILPDEIGHGGSSKPSDALRAKFPRYNCDDMVQAQYRLLTEHLGVRNLRLIIGGSTGGMPRRAPQGADPRGGHLVFGDRGELRVVSFDVATATVTGTPATFLPNVSSSLSGAVSFDVAADSTLAFLSQSFSVPRSTLAWRDATGKEEALPLQARRFTDARISPDGTRLLLRVIEDSDKDGVFSAGQLWLWSVATGALGRLTLETNGGDHPLWSPDGRTFVYRAGNAAQRRRTTLSLGRPDGSGEPTRFPENTQQMAPQAWTPQGELVLQSGPAGAYDLLISDASRSQPRKLVAHPSVTEGGASVSPDGRWLAYSSNETGRGEVYVRGLRDVDAGKWQVSTESVVPLPPQSALVTAWSRDSKTLYFVNLDGTVVMASTIRAEPAFGSSVPRKVLDIPRGAIVADMAPDTRPDSCSSR